MSLTYAEIEELRQDWLYTWDQAWEHAMTHIENPVRSCLKCGTCMGQQERAHLAYRHALENKKAGV